MKKVVFAAVAVLALASCKKDWTCECTTTGNGVSATVSGTVTGTKKDAKNACEKGSTTAGEIKTECKIK